KLVTGVQTCALPIYEVLRRQVAEEVEAVRPSELAEAADPLRHVLGSRVDVRPEDERLRPQGGDGLEGLVDLVEAQPVLGRDGVRSEERRVGKECGAG